MNPFGLTENNFFPSRTVKISTGKQKKWAGYIYILSQGERPTQQGASLLGGKLQPPSFLPLSFLPPLKPNPLLRRLCLLMFSKAGHSSALFPLSHGLVTSSPVQLPQGWLVILLPKCNLSFFWDQKPLFLILNPRCTQPFWHGFWVPSRSGLSLPCWVLSSPVHVEETTSPFPGCSSCFHNYHLRLGRQRSIKGHTALRLCVS